MPADDPPRHDAPSADAGRRVLFVDDDATNRSLMGSIFAAYLPDVVLDQAASGAEALVRVTAEPPSLILLDRHLGDTVLEALVPRLEVAMGAALPPIVAVSGAPPDPAVPTPAAVVAHVMKPFRIAQLVELVTSLLGDRPAGGR